MKTAVEWQFEQLFNSFEKFNNGEYTFHEVFKRNLEIREQAKEMEKQHNISLLEWIRENAVEVQDGWQYLGKVYTDKQIIEYYNKTYKSE
jgi:hypothetical protein